MLLDDLLTSAAMALMLFLSEPLLHDLPHQLWLDSLGFSPNTVHLT
jgi:hypothetical protein